MLSDGGRVKYRISYSIVAADETSADIAVKACLRFGKGRHPAKLNFGDYFSYALARQLVAPYLFKGDHFSRTDTRSALKSWPAAQ
jgi:ribonuclease VapC